MGIAGKNFSEQHLAKQPDEIPADGFQESEPKCFHRSRQGTENVVSTVGEE